MGKITSCHCLLHLLMAVCSRNFTKCVANGFFLLKVMPCLHSVANNVVNGCAPHSSTSLSKMRISSVRHTSISRPFKVYGCN